VKAPVSWLREFVDVPDDPPLVARRLAACGFAVESIQGDVIDFEVTANRPDCLSVFGLSREAAVAFDTPLKPVPSGATTSPVTASDSGHTPITVSIEDPACGRYALAVADVVVGPSPDWICRRLVAAGVRPINNVVDVTNYVMLEVGHPMHAFDAARLSGGEIRVRAARPGEPIRTLDGETRTLDTTVLAIADRDHAVAVAGVMGGASSEVSDGTTRIAIESAWFVPGSVRTTSRRLGLKTEASARFERGADINAPVPALQRALNLLADIGAGAATGAVVDVYPAPAASRRVLLRGARIRQLLGQDIPADQVSRILNGLGFALEPAGDGLLVTVPSFRVDVSREADLIEEVGRHWGFDRIPATLPPLREAPPPPAPNAQIEAGLRDVALGAGVQEAVTFTFIERAMAEPFVAPGGHLVAIANPLSEKFAVLRPSLLPGLLDSLVYNRRRESDLVRLFELGSVFHADGETTRIGWVMAGARAEHWSGPSDSVDFFDAKGLAEVLAQVAGIGADELTAAPDDALPWFLRGAAARLSVVADGTAIPLGSIGQLRPDLVRARGLDGAIVVGGEMDVRVLLEAGRDRAGRALSPIPRFPSIVRDLSIFVPERLPAADVRGTIRQHAPLTLVAIGEFDRYQGKGVPDGHVSLSIRLTFRDADRTLTDGDVQPAVDAIVRALTRLHGAVLRGKV
jgi:phenylalanyl-tRNA synthetase beta chain